MPADAPSPEDRRLAEVLAAHPELVALSPSPPVTEAACARATLAGVVEAFMLGYAGRPALGERPTDAQVGPDGCVVDVPRAEYRTVTYDEAWTRARAIATALAAPPAGAEPDGALVAAGERLCSLATSSVDYCVLELSLIAAGVVSVPLGTSAPPTQWGAILRETRPRALAVGVELLGVVTGGVDPDVLPPTLIVLAQGRPPQRVHEVVGDARAALAGAGAATAVVTLAELVDRGRSRPPAPLFAPEPGSEPLAQILYTSGSTGSPKGAMFTEPGLMGPWMGFAHLPRPGVFLHFMPMSHINGRIALVAALSRGGTCYAVGSSDLSTLLEDLALVRPTEMYMVPRVCELIRDRFVSELATRTARGADPATARRETVAEVRERVLGGRVLLASNGSALLSDDVRSLMEEVLGLPLHEGFGTTETGTAFLIDHQVMRPLVIDYKLVDVPELGYFSTDRPHPRGELLVKTHTMIGGYYGRPDLDQELFDEDGYCRTGDVMAETAPDELHFVDRRNNVLKLSQAEFVTISTVEDALLAAALVDQIVVHGRAGRPFLVAVVVPTAAAREAHPDPAALRTALVRSLRARAEEAGLAPYEVPRDVLVEPEPFTSANGLLSEVGKPLRPALRARYGERLDALAADLEARREEDLASLRRGATGRPVLETVLAAAIALTGATTDPGPDTHFAELGGDSLSALSFSAMLRDVFGVEVPVSTIVGPTATLGTTARAVEDARSGAPVAATVRSVHGGAGVREAGVREAGVLEAVVLEADDLVPAAFLDAASLPAAPPPRRPDGDVLVTGANGFLGRFVVLELIERGESGVIALVRATSDAQAHARLESALDTGDDALLERFRVAAASGRLRVLAGDVTESRLGVAPREWAELADRVGTVVHAAALVNHVLPYDHLFAPNVRGTAEVVRLALTTRLKAVVHVSTTGIADQVDGPLDEQQDVRRLCPTRTPSDDHAAGYAASKWAAEVLLRHAHEQFGLPVTVLRSGLILAHRHHRGQVNPADTLTRLLLSLLLTGLAPPSFHAPDAAAPPVGGLPVDVVASSTVRLGLHRDADGADGHRTYNVVDPDPDAPSLDTLVDWLADAAPLTRVADHADWLHRLEIALRAVPEPAAGATVLPLLDAFRSRPGGPPPEAVPTARFVAAVREAAPDGAADVAGASRELIAKYVSDLAALGLR